MKLVQNCLQAILLFISLIGVIDAVLFVDLNKFSRIGDAQYFIYTSSESPFSHRVKLNESLAEIVDEYCENTNHVLEAKVCKEIVPSNSSNGKCREDSIAIDGQCVKFHKAICPPNYHNIAGKCMIDAGCDKKLYDQVGKKCYEKCKTGYRRYYSNLCITEEKSCPIQFRRNETKCILAECPLGMSLSTDKMYCEMECPRFFKNINETTCQSFGNLCPLNYEKEGYKCVLNRCKKGLLMYGVCLDTECPDGYHLKNNVCTKCLTSTHSYCSGMDWKCPNSLIEIGSGPYMKCVMICPRNYAQFGKHCMDISVTSCPENQYHFMGNKCINDTECPKDYEIFGQECIKKVSVSTFLVNGRECIFCPPNYIEFNDQCVKLSKTNCPSGVLRIEETNYCVENCPDNFVQAYDSCIKILKCGSNQYSFMGRCFDFCPTGTTMFNATQTCQVLHQCQDDKLYDLTRFRCIEIDQCKEGFFPSPDKKFCHKKDQCNGQGYILDQYCVNSCPLDYEVNTQFCTQKSSKCPSLSLTNGTCVSSCPEGHIPKNRICIEVTIKKSNLVCGVNKELIKNCNQLNGSVEIDCIGKCVCKPGFIEDPEEDYCVPEQITCSYTHQLDVVFLIDGSENINTEQFNDIKFFLMETVTNIYSSNLDVRVAIHVYGSKNPQVVHLYETLHLCNAMQKLSYLIEEPSNSSLTSLVDALKVTQLSILSQCNGARLGSTRQLFIIGAFAEFAQDTIYQEVLQQIQQHQQLGNRIAFISINKQIHLTESVYRFFVNDSKQLSTLQSQIFAITCKDFSCPQGYQRLANKCTDINECDSSVCHESSLCINEPGSHLCYCSNNQSYLGNELGCGTSRNIDCNTSGNTRNASHICDAVKCLAPANCSASNGMAFCVCPRGYQYNSEFGCIDIDECKNQPCLGEESFCQNTEGSFNCSCQNGFQYNRHFGCIDIDECADATICSGNGICKNLVGNYRCACHPGFEYIVNNGCIDIDECNQTSNLCQGDKVLCVNTLGSFKCMCPPGYEYQNNDCVDINECRVNNTCPEGSLCKNTLGGVECACARGFIYHNLTNTCELDKTLNVVQPKADLIFGIDVSKNMENYMNSVMDMLRNIITDYKLKSLATIKHYFALTLDGSSIQTVFTEETDANVLNRTSDIRYQGGSSSIALADGLKSSIDLLNNYAQVNSSKLVIFITATAPSKYSSDEITQIKSEISEIKKDSRLLIIYIGLNVQSEEWKVIFRESEVEEHVIAVANDFITTIHKVIYQKTDRLIKCPEGFVFLDQVCQYKTLKSSYCKWDNKLYALNSSWNNSCAIYKCTDNGVVVLDTMCMGFDGDCYKENEFFPCNLNGKLNWRCKCRIVEYFEEETNKTQQRIDYIIINFDRNSTISNTKLEDNGSCVLPFKYQNQWNYACTDHMSIKRWCSWNMIYKPREYSYCARQVTSQCIFDGKTYHEGDKWTVGCNLVTCSTGIPYITARCSTLNDTCVPLNADNYPCRVRGDSYTSCMCLQDNFGYGENNPIQGKISRKSTNKGDGGDLLHYCEHKGTGKQYQLGETWIQDCFTMKCVENGVSNILEKKCKSVDGSCIAVGSSEHFQCHIGGKLRNNCQCVEENDELVLLANDGGKAERKVISNKTVIDL